MKTNKIIKIIDLLKEISNGNIPKKIRFLNHYYIWKENDEDYQKEDGLMLFGNCKINYILNTEVEIIEEEKKLPEKLEDISEIKCVGCKVEIDIKGNKTLFDTDTPIVTEHCIYKINQLIKNQKKIIDYLENEEKGE